MELFQKASQSQRLVQTLRMGREQIQAMKILSLATSELEGEMYEFAEKNPALEVSEKSAQPSSQRARSRGSAADFDALIERKADNRKSLYEHLKFQLNALNLPETEHEIGIKLIENLDQAGHHILSPYSFLDRSNPLCTQQLIEKVVSLIQGFDPVGTCVKDVPESLFVQAKNSGAKNDTALFLLDGHFDFLDPPRPEKILKKLKDFSAAEKKLKSYDSGEGQKSPDFDELTLSDVENALAFIRTLDPKPARGFGTDSPNYVRVDAFVKVSGEEIIVSFPKDELPDMKISSDYETVSNSKPQSESGKADAAFARQSISEAKSFIEAVHYRKTTLERAAAAIASWQSDFFIKGPAFLKPFLQRDLAAMLNVHEATVSRIANGKYLSCDFGVFPFAYFFTNQVGAKKSESLEKIVSEASDEKIARGKANSGAEAETKEASKESVKFHIAEILKKHKDDKKPLSDQKISDILLSEGIKVARRTVAKYRAELNLGSSYER